MLTHALALGAGWAVYQAAGTGEGEASGKAVATVKSSARDKELSRRAARIIDTARAAADKTYHRGLDPDEKAEIEQAIKEVKVPADIAAALELIALSHVSPPGDSGPNNPQAAALLYHWLAKNPEEAFAWAKASTGATGDLARDHLWKAIAMLTSTQDPASLVPMLASAEKYSYGRGMASSLAGQIGRNPDPALIARVKESVNPETWNEFLYVLPNTWPPERGAEFLKFALAENSPNLVAAFNPGPGMSQGQWIKKLLEDESVPAEFREKIRASPAVKYLLERDPQLSFEERLALSGKPDTPETRAEIGRRGIDDFLGNDQDWPRAVRLGEATASEVLEAALAANPEVAASNPEAVRDRVFSRLLEQDPAAAMTLLEGLPAEERAERALYAARTDLKEAKPENFLALLQQVPAETPEQWEGRLDAWNRSSNYHHGLNGEHYAGWVQALPPGLDREMGLYALARQVAVRDPALAASLRAQISDPRLKNRLSSPR